MIQIDAERPPQLLRNISPCILLLNGFPGVGKFTISKVLQLIIPSENLTRLLNNHLTIHPVSAILPECTPEHYTLRKKFRDLAFNTIADLKVDNLVVIMTACLVKELEIDREQYVQHVRLAKKRGVDLCMVNLVCEVETNKQRLQSEERVKGQEKGKSKLVNGDVLLNIRRDFSLLDPSEMKTEAGVGKVTVRQLALDTTELSAEGAAQKVLKWLCRQGICAAEVS
ncbi:hypothetical protein B7463_g1374, partial [Scytalidium lignicola]